MDDFYSHYDEIIGRIAGSNIILFLNFEGTIAHSSGASDKCTVFPSVSGLIDLLINTGSVRVAVVSSFRLQHLKESFNTDKIYFAASHGREIEGPGIKIQPADEDFFDSVAGNIKRSISDAIAGIEGVEVVDTTDGIAVLYNNVKKEEIPLVRRHAVEAAEAYAASGIAAVREIKESILITQDAERNRGNAVLAVLMQVGDEKTLPIYIGGGPEDEQAFEKLKGKGINIITGEPVVRSSADYYLDGPEKVSDFLLEILMAKKGM
jgi:trehalose 6-phosphate phosphatase